MSLASIRIVLLFLAVSGSNISAIEALETNKKTENQILFKIERSKDPNEIWYTTNLNSDGSLNQDMPIKVFWVKKTENNVVEQLTGIQKRFSYGIKAMNSVNTEGSEWHFQLAAYSDRIFKLKRMANGQYTVFTRSGTKEIALTQIFIKFDGGSFMFPSIAYAKLIGIEPQSGIEISEVIIPDK
jgi:hypothetical protein